MAKSWLWASQTAALSSLTLNQQSLTLSTLTISKYN